MLNWVSTTSWIISADALAIYLGAVGPGGRNINRKWNPHNLTIRSSPSQVNQHDAGTYSCVAYNKCGRADTSAKMTTLSAADADFQSKSWSSIQQMEMSKQGGNSIDVYYGLMAQSWVILRWLNDTFKRVSLFEIQYKRLYGHWIYGQIWYKVNSRIVRNFV